MQLKKLGTGRVAWVCALAVLGLACGEQTPGTEVDRTARALTAGITISGRVVQQDGTAVSGVTVDLAGSSQAQQITDSSGQYAFGGLNAGSFSVRASKEGCSFSPDVVNLNSLTSNRTQDFVASGAGCGSSHTITWTEGSILLTAQRDYSANRWQDADVAPAQPVSIRVPATLPVVIGNAGTGSATLSYWVSWGEVRCEYRGGSSVAHPTTPVQIAEGHEYHLQYCWDGAQGGAERVVSRVKLHIQEGDASDPAQFTEVHVRLGGTATMEPPLSRAQSVALREGFRWADTLALPETNSEGLDSLWYAQIYVQSKEEKESLKWLYIHHDTLPLFNVELSRWSGQTGVFSNETDGVGNWVYAVIPGITYNQIRAAALNGDEIFHAMVLRQPPADARNADGSLSYAALARNGFVYEADLSVVVPDDDAALNQASAVKGLAKTTALAQPKARPRLLRGLIRAIAAVVKGVTNAVQRVCGAVDRWVNGSVNYTVALDVLNLDPTFGTQQPFQRSWGANRCQEAKLPDVRIEIRQWAPLGITTMFTEHSGDDGTAKIKVGRYRDSMVCMDVENKAAMVTEGLFPRKLCTFTKADSLLNDFTNDWQLAVVDSNLLMQATEGRAYLTTVVGVTPAKADILVGGMADLIGRINGDRAFAPCLGLPNARVENILGTSETLLLLVPIVGPTLSVALRVAESIYGTTDIVFPAATSGGLEAQTSRGVPTHEYGHFALCNLMTSVGPWVLSEAYTDCMIEALTQNLGEASVLNEAFADFFTAQVAGGTNYFTPPGARASQGIKYCDATAVRPCMDGNGHLHNGDYNDNIQRVATMLHDAFDGQASGGDVPGNADVWVQATSPWTCASTGIGDKSDEPVAMPAAQMLSMLAHWTQRSSTLTEDSFLAGVADAMSDSGYTWCDRCQLFALHDQNLPASASDRQKFDLCQTEPISKWLGTAPDRTDPTSCLFGAYFQGCRNGGASMCDELVDAAYFVNHPACTSHTACIGQYAACSNPSVCPVPTADEIPNAVLKAAGVPTASAQLSLAYTWYNGYTGGINSATLTSQPWAEMQAGVGVHAPPGDVTVFCSTSESGHTLASLTVSRNDGTTQSLPCSSRSCSWDVPVNAGFSATCNFDVEP